MGEGDDSEKDADEEVFTVGCSAKYHAIALADTD